MAAAEVKDFIEENTYLELITDGNGKEKVKCKLTGHQLPCRLSDIITYTSGKKYQRLVNGLTTLPQQQAFVPEDYKEYLVPSKKSKSQLYCKVTKKLINNIPHQIQQHVKGKRFQRELKSYKETLEKSADKEEPKIWNPSDSASDSEPDNARLSDSFLDEEEEQEESAGIHKETDSVMQTNNNTKTRTKTGKKQKTDSKVKPSNDKEIKTVKTRKRQSQEQSQTKTLTKKSKKQTASQPSQTTRTTRSKTR